MGLAERLKRGLTKSREALNELFYFGGEVDEDFWEQLEDTLVLSDVGAAAAAELSDDMRDIAARENLKTAEEIKTSLANRMAALFPCAEIDPFSQNPVCVLFVGINGSGKTTTIGKLAASANESGRNVVLGGADTFRAAAIEQLSIWAQRAGVPLVTRERGADPASVCYDVLDAAERDEKDFVLIDTAGRLHTSEDLMRELQKVVSVTRKRATIPVYVVLVIDATTGQNGLIQAKEFNAALDLDGVILTKLDGSAKGGIAAAIAHELNLPILRVGIGEGISDLEDFDALEFSRALIGDEHESAESVEQ